MWRAMRLSPTNDVSIRSMVAEGTEERFLALHIEVMTSAVVKLAGESDEPAPDVVVYGMVSRCSPVSLLQPMVAVGPRQTAGYMERSMHLSPVSTDNVATLSAPAARGGD